MRSLLLTLILMGFQITRAGALGDVKAPDEITVEGKKLVLNGMGYRVVEKFGFDIKVYVGELYTEQKTKDSEAIIKSEGPRVVVMHFLVSLDRDKLLEAFQAGLENGCYLECDKRSAQWALLSPKIVSMRQGNELRFVFHNDKLEVIADGPNAEKVMLDTPADAAKALSHNLLSMFINSKKPPTEALRRGLLGL